PDFNNDHGIRVNLPLVLPMLLAEREAELEAEVLPSELTLLSEPVPLSDTTAKSIRLEFGLTIMSSICPICPPEASFTWAPISLVARNGCADRPVALMCRLVQFFSESLDAELSCD